MTKRNLFFYSYVSFRNTQLPMFKVVALWPDKTVIHNAVGASWDAIGAYHIVRDAGQLFEDARLVENYNAGRDADER